MICYDSPYLTVSWNTTECFTHIEFKRLAEGDNFKIGLDKIIEVLEANQGFKHLGDLRNMRVISLEDQFWGINNWTPRAMKAGLRYAANVYPKLAMSQVALQDVIMNVEGVGLEIANFLEPADAIKWLSTKKQT